MPTRIETLIDRIDQVDAPDLSSVELRRLAGLLALDLVAAGDRFVADHNAEQARVDATLE